MEWAGWPYTIFDGKIGKNETGRKALKSHIEYRQSKDDEKQQQTSTQTHLNVVTSTYNIFKSK